MLSKKEFIQFIVDGPQAESTAKKSTDEADSALPEGFGGFGFDAGDEVASPDSGDASFARNLLIAAGFGNPEHIERSEVILSTDAAAKHLPDLVYYWPKSDDRPYQTLLFELEQPGSDVLKTALFKQVGKQQLLEDALSRFVQHTLRGFEKGGERRTASVRQGRQTETLCIISVLDDREKENEKTHLVCFGTKNKANDSLESFHIREEAKLWEPQIRDDHLGKLYDRHFKKLASDKWQNAFISKEERKLARKLLDTCIDNKATEHEIEKSVINLLEEIAGSFGIRRQNGKRLKPFQLPKDHDIGSDPETRGESHNPFQGMTLRDEKNRLLGYIIYCLDEKQDAEKLRNYLQANNRFHNVLVIYPDGDHAELELWQGKTVLPGKLLKSGANYSGEGEVVNLLSRFFVVSKAKVKNPVELAEELAFRARYLRRLAIKELVENKEEGPLRELYTAFKETLVHDQTEEEFADAFAQTLTYGLLTSRWMGSDKLAQSGERFTRQTALKYLPSTSNFLKELFETALAVKLDDQRGRLLWLVDDIANLLDRIDVTYVFGEGDKDSDQATDPVIHFYEPFLAAYDNELRNKRGVYFTPKPVVSFIVRSVHETLQKEFGLEDGLASTNTWGDMQKRFPDLELPEGVKEDDPFVCILDPATGTGTFLYECVEVIERTMKEKWCKELSKDTWDDQNILKKWREYVPMYLLPRLYGYELMMASYAIAHLKLAFKLGKTDYIFKSSEKLHVYLTNTLAAPFDRQQKLTGMMPALAFEADEVNNVKIKKKFTIAIGNPPYMGESSNISKDEYGNNTFIGDLIKPYFYYSNEKLAERNVKWIHDDYVKFTRYAQSKIEESGYGIFSFITNNSYIDSPTFRGMREHLQNKFNIIYILDLHGNIKRSSITPSGEHDDNVFDIQQGVAICVMVRNDSTKNNAVFHKDIWGSRSSKYKVLTDSSLPRIVFSQVCPSGPLNLFLPINKKINEEFEFGTPINEIFWVSSVGIVTARDAVTIQWNKNQVRDVVNDFAKLPDDKIRKKYKLPRDVRDWKVRFAKEDIRKSGPVDSSIIPILYRPFDKRYTYYTGKSRGFLCMPRPKVMHHMIAGSNLGIITTRQQSQQGVPWKLIGVTDSIIESCSISNKTREINYLFPLYLYPSQDTLFDNGEIKSNIKDIFVESLLQKLNVNLPKKVREKSSNRIKSDKIFYFIYAQINSKIYRTRYEELLKRQFPNIFFPRNYDIFIALSKIGKKLVSLNLLDQSDKWLDRTITSGLNGFHFKSMHDKCVKPSFPKFENNKIYINKSSYYETVSNEIWTYQVGSYQVCLKWLKDRKNIILNENDVLFYKKVLVAIQEIIHLQAEIDKVIDQHGGWPGAFVTTDQGGDS